MSFNMNNLITGGSVTVEDGLKAKEEYAPARKVAVTLSFSTPEGVDGVAILDFVAALANGRMMALLYGKTPVGTTAAVVTAPKQPETPAAAVVTAPKQPETPAAPVVKAETAAAKKKREAAEKAAAEKPAERTKADLEREMLEAAGAKKPATDDELLEDEPTITATGAVVSNDDDLGDLLGEAAPPPVTDLELGKAAQEKNAKMKAELGEAWAPANIRGLISKYSEGKRINDIAAAKRPQFLKELNALT